MQEERLEIPLNNSALTSIFNPEGVIIYVNDMLCEISGYTEHELIGEKYNILKSGKHTASVFQDMWSTIRSNKIWKGVICNKRKDGSFYRVCSIVIPFVNALGDIEKYISVCFDITQSIENKENLKKMETKFKFLFDAVPDASFILDLEGNILNCNTAAEIIFGYKEKELIDKKIYKSILLSETDKRLFIKALKTHSTPPHKIELQITTKNAEVIDVELVHHHIVFYGKNLFLIMFHNITEPKIILNDLHEKTKELELLLYRSAHDLRSSFTPRLGLLNLIKQEANSESVIELLDRFENVLLSEKIVVDNISVSSLILNKSIKKEQLDLNKFVNKTLNNLEYLEDYNNISFNINIPEGLTLNSNEQLLSRIFKNLLQNAIKYQKPISSAHTPFIIINGFKTKDGIKISIKDNGIGINSSELDQIFNLYVKSNRTAVGIGLGLYITKKSVKQLNGEISTKSIVNKETQFDILLPNS